MMLRKKHNPQPVTLPLLLKELRRTGRRLEDVPPTVLREVQKQGFPDMRSIVLAPPRIIDSLRQPLLRDLLVTRIGYCSRAAGHMIPRPEGSLDHILHYCVAGRGWLRIADREWDIAADTMVFIPRGIPHSYGANDPKPWSIHWIHFTGRQAGEFLDALGVGADHPLLPMPQDAAILSALLEIEGRMADVHTHVNLLAASTALARFLGTLPLRQHPDTTSPSDGEAQRLAQTIRLMREHLNRAIPLRELAQLAHMSVTRYVAKFAEQTGCTPIHYFNRMKVQHACRLLNETDMPVRTIGEAIGISDAYYFSRFFRKLIGIPPRAFRQHHRPALER
jgi:AraC family transcriptional regulator, arabinose operon regulatory protein